MRSDDLDALLTEWLGDGPLNAPSDVVDGAIDLARQTSARRLPGAHTWRRIMTRFEDVRPARDTRSGWAMAAIIASVTLIAVGAFGTWLAGQPPPPREPIAAPASAGPGPTEHRSPTARPLATPELGRKADILFEHPGPISATRICSVATRGREVGGFGSGGDLIGLELACTDVASDERVSGTTTEQVQIVDGVLRVAIAITNGAGGWTGVGEGPPSWRTSDAAGRWIGYATSGELRVTLHGTGAYAGLDYRLSMMTDFIDSVVSGTILPASRSSDIVTMTSTCTTEDHRFAAIFEDGSDRRLPIAFQCSTTASDDRLSGVEDVRISITGDPGTFDLSGTSSLGNVDGNWLGYWSGTISSAGTKSISGIYQGTLPGRYDGLEFWFTATGDLRSTTAIGELAAR